MRIITIWVFSLLVGINCAYGGDLIQSKLPVEKLPNPKACAYTCHNVGNVYEEFSLSAHNNLECFDCHLPSKVQEVKYNNKEDRGFFKFGHYKQGQTWEETPGNEVCLRCHSDEGMANTEQDCWTCHMPEHGEDHITFSAKGTDSLKKRLRHRSHTFKMHINR